MFKFLILLTVLSIVASEEKDWFKGKWLVAFGYTKSTCVWIEFSPALTTECVCGNKSAPLVAMVPLKNSYSATAFPVIMYEDMDGLRETFEQVCQCYNGTIEYPVVFRKISEDYMVGYFNIPGSDATREILFVRKVPKLSEQRKVMSEIEDLRNRTSAIICDPNYFAN